MVEIGCVEIFNRVETGRHFHAYFNPERDMPFEAQEVHGLGNLFLSDKPRFFEKRRRAARFHRGLPARRAQCGVRFRLPECRARNVAGAMRSCIHRMVDTLALARSRHPGAKHSLDALCVRFGIDRSHRVKHGALARRAASCAGLCRADRRPADRARAGRRSGQCCRPRLRPAGDRPSSSVPRARILPRRRNLSGTARLSPNSSNRSGLVSPRPVDARFGAVLSGPPAHSEEAQPGGRPGRGASGRYRRVVA